MMNEAKISGHELTAQDLATPPRASLLKSVTVSYWDGERWLLRLSDRQEVVGRDLAQARKTADRVVNGEFLPLVGRVIEVRS